MKIRDEETKEERAWIKEYEYDEPEILDEPYDCALAKFKSSGLWQFFKLSPKRKMLMGLNACVYDRVDKAINWCYIVIENSMKIRIIPVSDEYRCRFSEKYEVFTDVTKGLVLNELEICTVKEINEKKTLITLKKENGRKLRFVVYKSLYFHTPEGCEPLFDVEAFIRRLEMYATDRYEKF